jgi:hypothetical protein
VASRQKHSKNASKYFENIIKLLLAMQNFVINLFLAAGIEKPQTNPQNRVRIFKTITVDEKMLLL